MILVIIILAGYVLNSLGPTIFQAKKAVDQFGNEIEQQNRVTEKNNLLDKIKNERNLSGLDLRNLNLQGYDFSGKILDNTNWGHYVQYGSALQTPGANIDGADFSNTDLRKVKHFESCQGCNFRGANLSGMTLDGFRFIDSDFTNADLSGMTIHLASFSRNDFTNADLSNSYISAKCSFPGTVKDNDFTNADLRGMELKCLRIGYNIGADLTHFNNPASNTGN